MHPLQLLVLILALGGAALAAPAAAESATGSPPWRVRFSAAVEEPGPGPPAPSASSPLLAPGRGPRGEPRREEASLDARYRLDLGRTSRFSLRYRGILAREGALTPRDRQRHVPELRFRQELAEGWTARIGLEARAEWEEESGSETLSLGEQSFAELDADLGERLGRTRLRYEHRRAGLLRAASASASRSRVALRQEMPRLSLGGGAALELRPKLALAWEGKGPTGEWRSRAAELTARLETGAGPRIRTRLAYTRRTREARGERGSRRDRDVLGVATRLELPLREGLRLELGLGWEGVSAEQPRASASRLRARSSLELRF